MSRRAAILLAACLPAALAGLSGVHAEEASAADRLLGKTPEKSAARACFVRTYDAAHLARHPQQKVAAMLLLVRGEKDAEEGEVNYSFSLGVKFRAKPRRFLSAGDCGHAKIGESDAAVTLSCGVDCDGGGLNMALAPDDKSTLVSIDEIAVWPAGQDDDPEKRSGLRGGADDRSFRLGRAPLAQCLPLADDRKEAAAIRRGK